MKKNYFCEEPWTGIFSIRTSGDCICCPCYAQVKIGNIYKEPIEKIWNSPKLVEMRESFSKGELPEPCKNQLCFVVAGNKQEK